MIHRTFSYGIEVSDPVDWPEDAVAAAEEDDSKLSYSDWAVDQLREAMREAGEKFISDNAQMFEGNLF